MLFTLRKKLEKNFFRKD